MNFSTTRLFYFHFHDFYAFNNFYSEIEKYYIGQVLANMDDMLGIA